MSVEKIKLSMTNLSNAINRLEEALQEPLDNKLSIDGTIQRFEFCIELFWKTLSRLLDYEGIDVKNPRDAMKHSYQQGWLKDEAAWLQMWDARNETSHIYNEEKAKEIYLHIKDNFKELKTTLSFLQDKFSEILN